MQYLISIFVLLFFNSCGNTSASSPKKLPKVSVICPTYDRDDRHESIYRAFEWQSYENRELLILDDSEKPSPFFTELNDPRVKYFYEAARTSIGNKRNQLVERATGEIIAHFDDDDYYAPNYLTEMVAKLGDADFIKFSKWLAWRELDGSLWEWDTTFIPPFQFNIPNNSRNIVITRMEPSSEDAEWIEKNTWGYSFSYLYRKSIWDECRFEDTSFGEDYPFIAKAKALGKKVLHIPDNNHLVLHTLHAKSMSSIFPQLQLPASLIPRYLGENVKPWLVTLLQPQPINQHLLDQLFASYWKDDPALESFARQHNFDKYEVCYVEGRDGYYIEKETPDLIKSYFLKKGYFWEKHIYEQFQRFVRPGSTVVDVGGHIGTHTLSLSKLVGRHGIVHVFEPQLKLFSELILNMHLNSCNNVVFHRKALGEKSQVIEMDPINIINEGNTSIGAGGDTVQMERLDDLQLTNVSLIKIDVEGYEDQVIDGALNTIMKQKPVLIVEIHSNSETFKKIDRIRQLGYVAYNLSNVHDYLFVPVTP